MRVFKRTWRGTLAVVLLLTVAHATATFVMGRKVEAEIEKIRAAGEPVSCAELAGPAIPASENGALDFEKAIALMRAMPLSMHKFESPEFGFDERAKNPGIWDDVRRELVSYNQVFTLVEKGASKPQCRYNTNWKDGSNMLFKQFAGLRSIARLLAADAYVKAHYGDMEGAVRSLELGVAASESLRNEPAVICMLVRISLLAIDASAIERIAGSAPISEDTCKRLYMALSPVSIRADYPRVLKGERAFVLTWFQEIKAQKLGSLEQLNSLAGLQTTWLARPLMYADELECLKRANAAIKTAGVPGRLQTGSARMSPPTSLFIMASTMMPVYSRLSATVDKAEATVRGTQLFLALRAYKSKFGSYPTTLSGLKAKIAWGLNLEDPCSGKPYVYRVSNGGFILYSFGTNFKDDGGVDWREPKLLNREQSDIVWKMER